MADVAMETKYHKPGNFSLSGFFKLTRVPNLLIIAATQYLTAIFLAGGASEAVNYLKDEHLFLLALSTVLIAASGYIINDYYDVKIDFVNKPERVIVGKVLKRRVVMVAHTALNVTGILMGFYLSFGLGLLNFMAAFLLWLYSNQLKRLPFIGNLTIALLSGAAIAAIALYYQQNEFLIYTYSLFAFSITLIREIIKDMEDLQGDERFGCKTIPIILGLRNTKYILYGLIVLFIFVLFYLSSLLGNPILTQYFMVLIIPVIYFIYRLIIADTKKDFAFLSNFSKILILSGVVSMVFF